MKTELLLAGVACVVAAAVGGGLKLVGAEFPLLSSTRRQVLLAAIGLALVAAGLVIPSEEEQRRTGALQQQRRDLVIELSGRLEQIGIDLNRMLGGQEVPGLIQDNEIPVLTDVYRDLETNRATLGDDLHDLLAKKADFALSLANVRTADDRRELGEAWARVNHEIAERLAWQTEDAAIDADVGMTALGWQAGLLGGLVRYPAVRNLRENAWADFVPFLYYSPEIRRVIYSTDENRQSVVAGLWGCQWAILTSLARS